LTVATHLKPELNLYLAPLRPARNDDAQESQTGTRLRIWAQSSVEQAVIHCYGDIVYRREADHLLDRVVEYDQRQVVVDLKHVRALDAYGLGRLLAIQETMTKRDQHLTFVNPSERIQMLFNLTKLDFCFMCACGRMLQ
jgi:anti-anti-sigma factor